MSNYLKMNEILGFLVFSFICLSIINCGNNSAESYNVNNTVIDNSLQNTKIHNVNSLIDQFIAENENKYNAIENKKVREVIWDDMNADSKKDAIILYTLENFGGSNLHIDYLAVFLTSPNGELKYTAHKVIGGKNRRAVIDVKSVINGIVNLDTLDYLPTDASCCPSKNGHAQIALNKNKLIELNNSVDQ